MTPGYVKLFRSILDSTVWAGGDADLRVWIAILALKDANDHTLRMSLVGLANRAKVTVEACEAAVKRFEAPDHYSTSQEFEGRRLRRIDGSSWLVLNGEKYAKKLSEEQRREYQRQKQAEYRRRGKNPGSADWQAERTAQKLEAQGKEEEAQRTRELSHELAASRVERKNAGPGKTEAPAPGKKGEEPPGVVRIPLLRAPPDESDYLPGVEEGQ